MAQVHVELAEVGPERQEKSGEREVRGKRCATMRSASLRRHGLGTESLPFQEGYNLDSVLDSADDILAG